MTQNCLYNLTRKKIINDEEMASCFWETSWSKKDKVQRRGTFKQWNSKERAIGISKLKQWQHRNVQRLKTSKRNTLHCLKGSIAHSLKCQSCFPCGSNLLDRKVYLNKRSGKSAGKSLLSYSKSLGHAQDTDKLLEKLMIIIIHNALGNKNYQN